MTFAEIALKNMWKKRGNYLAFFCSVTFSVLIFQLFCTLYFNPAFENFRLGTGRMSALFKLAAAAVFVFALIFVLFSGNYFIRMQKKEIAVYSLLGMRKERIAAMMFLETFGIGLAAILCGSLAGAFAAGWFFKILMNLMSGHMEIAFTVKPAANLITALAFVAIFLLSGYRSYRTIYRYRLIELMTAEKKRETVPRATGSGAVLAAVLILAGYITSVCIDVNVGGMTLLRPAAVVLVCVCLGTYLLFRGLIPRMVERWRKNPRLFLKTANFVSISQIRFRLRANSGMLSVVAILTAVTITMISAAYTLYCGYEDTIVFYAPYSYMAKDVTAEELMRIRSTVSETGEVKIVDENSTPVLRVAIQSNAYAAGEEKQLGAKVEGFLISESRYRAIVRATHAPYAEKPNNGKTNFNGGLADATCFFLDGRMDTSGCDSLPGQTVSVSTPETGTSGFTVAGVGLHKYIGVADLLWHPTVIVTDAVYERFAAASPGSVETYYGFQFDEPMLSGKTVDAIDAFIPSRLPFADMPGNVSYISFYRSTFRLGGSYIFVLGLMGVLFLLTVGTILYYRVVTEAGEEAARYDILRKVGMNGREALHAIEKQLGMMFGFPLLTGLCHTVFALTLYNRMLEVMAQDTPTIVNAILAALVFVAVYAVFYACSVRSYYRMVWKREPARRTNR